MSLARNSVRCALFSAGVCALSLCLGLTAVGQDADKPKDAAKADAKGDADDKDADKKKDEEPKPSVTHGTATIDGKEIKYTATAGKMLMTTDEGDPKAHVFYIAYTVDDQPASDNDNVSRDARLSESTAERSDDNDDSEDNEDSADANDEESESDDEEEEQESDADDEDAEDDDKEEGNADDHEADDKDDADSSDSADKAPAAPNRRPVTFCFNGGPGSSSVWLHLGMLGPVRVKLDSNAQTLPPPHELIANPYSLLDVTDLVFVDPVSTGFSRPAKGEDKRQFHGYEEDLRSVGQFIHDYTTKYSRWASPKFVLGESYGGIRAAGLTGELRDRYHLELNGIVMISAVVDFQTLMAGGNNDIAYALFLPSFAATAWYHKALDDDLQDKTLDEVVDEAEEFAAGDYLQALAAGDSLAGGRRRRVVRRMAELTGLSEDYVDAANLRVSMPRFGKELLRKRRLVVGRFDSRYVGFDRNTLGEYAEHDPSADAVFGTFTSALNDYVRTTLKVDEPRVYEILTGNVQPWNYSEFANRYVNASDSLREAMTHNPFLHVYAACGYFDLATPSFAMEYTRDHLNLPPERRDHFTMGYYEGGHMMYAHEPSLEKLRKDLLEFYEDALPETSQSN